MGKNAPYFSKWPLHLESMGPFYNVKSWAVMFLYESLTRNCPCHRLANNIPDISLTSFLWDIGKQNSPRCDAVKCGVPSGAILFACVIFLEK